MTTEHENPAPEETPAHEAPKKPVKKAARKAAKKSTPTKTESSARPQTPSAPSKGKTAKAAPSKPLTEERNEAAEPKAPNETGGTLAAPQAAPETAPESAPEAQRPVASVNGTRSDAVDPAAFPPSETAIPPLDPTVPPPGGEKPIAYTPFAPLGAKGPHGDEPIEANLQRAILESTKKITDNAPALYELMKNDRTQPPVYVPTAPQHRPSGEASVPSPKPPKAPAAEPALQAAKPVKKTKKARKKLAKAVPNASTAPSPQGPAQVPSSGKAEDQTASEDVPKTTPKAVSKGVPKATPRIRFRVEDAPVEEEKKPETPKGPKGPKGPKPPLSDLFTLSGTDAEVLTTDEPAIGESASAKTFEGSEASAYPETPDMASPDDLDRPDDTPEAERLLGRRATLPRQTEARDAEGETLLSRPRVANVPMGRIARRALERTTERLAREEGRAVPKTAAEERNARILRAPHDVRPEDPDSLESIRSAMRAEEEVDAVLNQILESSRSVEEANAKMNKLLSELTACDPVRNPDGTTHYKIRDPEAFRRSILFSKLLLLPDLRTGPTWMRSVIRARHEAGCALKLTEAFTLELDRDALPEDSPLRLDDSGVFVERTTETPPPPDPAVTHFLTHGDTRRTDRRVQGTSPEGRGSSSPSSPSSVFSTTHAAPTAPSNASGPSGRGALRTAPLGVAPREAFLRTPWDAGVLLLKVSVFLGVAFVGGLLGGRTAFSDPGLLHTDRLAFVDLTSVAKSGFPDSVGFPEAFREVLNQLSEERGVVLVAKNFLLTGPAPETRDRDLTVEVITGLIDRLGMPGARGTYVPSWDLPKEVERVLMPSSTEAANARVGQSGGFDDPVARGRGTDALGVPYVKPLPEDASRTLFATEHAARASRLSALEAEKSAREATRAAEDLRREIERRKADRNLLKENGIDVP